MIRRLAVLALALSLPSCSIGVREIKVSGFHVGLFKKDARDRIRAAQDQHLLAERLLCGGMPPEGVVEILTDEGVDSADARKIVALAEANRVCANGAKK